ncbi:hypothetical protein Aph02nite_65730 [Actinoplanes philippinensis]|nr:hypothetical protein Aph02nite_65730 [Actinoplanes philippinensis]
MVKKDTANHDRADHGGAIPMTARRTKTTARAGRLHRENRNGPAESDPAGPAGNGPAPGHTEPERRQFMGQLLADAFDRMADRRSTTRGPPAAVETRGRRTGGRGDHGPPGSDWIREPWAAGRGQVPEMVKDKWSKWGAMAAHSVSSSS